MTHLRSVDPFGDSLLGVGHGLEFASSVFHLAREQIKTLGNLLCLLHGDRGCSLTSRVHKENTRMKLNAPNYFFFLIELFVYSKA